MKNLKKVLALVVVFSMMLCSVAFASFPDVSEDADYAVAVNTLAALGIVGGDDQGNFNPDNTITRAEFTKIVCEIQGLKGDANKGATAFTDVAADHWASGYINMATNLKIINGMGDGTFAPESPVTYEQAIKMLVVALGFEPMAADKGGYPTGHLVVAQTYGMTKNVAAPAQAEAAKRSLIAQIVYNTIDTPMMEQTGFGANVTYEVMDGTNDKDRTTLLTSKFGVVKLGGIVVANAKLSLDTEASAEDGEIAIRFDNNYKSTNEEFKLDEEFNGEEVGYANGLEIGETKADELIGKRVIAYVAEAGKGYEVIAIVAEEGTTVTKAFKLSDVDTGDRTVATGKGKLKLAYFETADADKSTQLKIEDTATLVWNNATVETAGDDAIDYITDKFDDGETDVSAKVEVVDWDDNGKYDLIKVSQYSHFVVDEIDEEEYKFTVVDSTEKFQLNEEEVEYDITLKNAAGEKIAFADIQTGDVIAVISSNIKRPAKVEDDGFIEITVLGQNAVEGAVKSTRDGEVKVGDTWYDVDAAYAGKDLTLGVEGMFYLGVDGQIIAFDGTKVAAGNYGIIATTAAKDNTWSESGYQIKMLNTDGQAVVYDLAEEVKIRNIKTDEYAKYALADTVASKYVDGTVFEDYAGKTLETILKKFNVNQTTAVEYRVVQYKVNSSNEITEIAPAVVMADQTSTAVKYDAEDKELGKTEIDATTVLFDVADVAADELYDAKVSTIEALLNDSDYKYIAFGYDVEIPEAVVITEGGASLTTSVESWAVVVAKSDVKDANDVDAYELEVVEAGSSDVKTITVTEDTKADKSYNPGKDGIDLASKMDIGSVILYKADADGVVTTIASIANIKSGKFDLLAKGTYAAGSDYETKYVAGMIADEADAKFELDNGNEYKVTSSTNEYRYYVSGRKTLIDVGSYNGGNVDGYDSEDDKSNYVLMRIVDGDVADIMSIDERFAYSKTLKIEEGDFSTATLNDVAGEVTDLVKNYEVEATVDGTVIEVVITAKDLKEHTNGADEKGYWIGFEIDLDSEVGYVEGTFGGEEFGEDVDGKIAFYVNAEDAKDDAEITLYDEEDGEALSGTYTITIDIDGVELYEAE